MARRLGSPLAEIAEVLQAQVVARQVEQGVEESGPVTRRKDEPVPVGPVRALRVEGEEASPEAQKRAKEGLEAYNLARELGVRILDVEDFVKLVRR